MNAILPDVAATQLPKALAPLDWVGMSNIDLPIYLNEPGDKHPHPAKASIAVDLPDSRIKGIHMSRLYTLLDSYATQHKLNPANLTNLLQQAVASHSDCQATRARLTLSFDWLQRRPALVTEGLSGWKAYPVYIEALWQNGSIALFATTGITYSSTCPCSAALARHLVEDAFMSRFGREGSLNPKEVADWLRSNASLATPHSQRSVAEIRVEIPDDAACFGLADIITVGETALGTPVQTAVKRADEQAFAQLNGENLMYVEDAARRLRAALSPIYHSVKITVRHLESLHSHDALAEA